LKIYLAFVLCFMEIIYFCRPLRIYRFVQTKKRHTVMKKDLHPETYRPVVFKDMSNGDTFISRSCINTRETIEFEGETYPVVKLEISSSSHPFYTGKSKLVDTAGRVDKFMNRYGDRSKK